MLQEDFDRLDRHGAVAVHRDARNLPGFHQILKHEEKFLRAFDGERRHDHTAAALDGLADDPCQFRPRIVRRVLAVAVSRLHHQNVGGLAFGGPRAHHFAGSAVLVAHAANVSAEQELSGSDHSQLSVSSTIADPRMCAAGTKRNETSGESCLRFFKLLPAGNVAG